MRRILRTLHKFFISTQIVNSHSQTNSSKKTRVKNTKMTQTNDVKIVYSLTSDELIRPLSAKHQCDFAYPTFKDRVPVIIAKIADTMVVSRDEILKKHGQPGAEDLKVIAGEMSRLRYELQTNKPLSDIVDKKEDAELWNASLEEDRKQQEGGVSKWFLSPWLLAECYCYRRIFQAVQLTSILQHVDPFEGQKRNAFTSSRPAIDALAHYMESVTSGDLHLHFLTLLKVSLWGNRCDLSISGGADNFQEDNILHSLSDLDSYLLTDDSESLWQELQVQGKPLTIVLDNAGFEVFSDLCLADFLIATGLASIVHLHIKAMPWFVSDVTKADMNWMLEQLKDTAIGKRWQTYIDDGRWVIHAPMFWTLPHPFYRMPEVDSKLYNTLKESLVVIFKGDLNFRKLTGDLTWPTETPFNTALQGFDPTKVAVLRTLKSDSVVGLQPGQDMEVAVKDKDWLINGKWAIILCSS